jgi:hypothetical protein
LIRVGNWWDFCLVWKWLRGVAREIWWN